MSLVSVDLKGNVIACAIGKSAARNIASKPNLSLFWPPREPGGYALVVNGTATGRREPGEGFGVLLVVALAFAF